jgi:transcriptional regulator with XRE-family HTH domain
MEQISPLREWREKHNISISELASACGIDAAELIKIEAGEGGIVGELQDYLTKEGENVSSMAIQQSVFINHIRDTQA